MPATKLLELFTPYFAALPDPRIDRGKVHDLLDILILALCATLGGANGWADIARFGQAKLDFFRQFLELPNGIPSHDTFGRVFARLDPAALLACIQRWLAAFPREQLLVVSTDELGERPGVAYASILAFLGAPPHELDDYPRVFDRDYPPMEPHTRVALAARGRAGRCPRAHQPRRRPGGTGPGPDGGGGPGHSAGPRDGVRRGAGRGGRRPRGRHLPRHPAQLLRRPARRVRRRLDGRLEPGPAVRGTRRRALSRGRQDTWKTRPNEHRAEHIRMEGMKVRVIWKAT